MSEFMSVACHEMRTPITSIKGYTDLLARGTVGPVNKAQIGFLDTVRSNADRIALLISDLSDVARIQSGRLSVDLASVDVRDVVRDTLETMQTQIEGKDQSLTIEMAENLPEVWADHERTVQVLSNLVSNAHKFTPTGGRIVVRAQPWAGGDGERGVVIAVEDNGIGIRAEEQEDVFEMFYRSEDRQASDMPGSGLGLSIASNLVEMQGGQIWLESTFREGTTVSFVLPAETRGA
jgi:signal transduction histidine kinase